MITSSYLISENIYLIFNVVITDTKMSNIEQSTWLTTKVGNYS